MCAAFQAGCRSERLPLLAVWVAAIRRSCPRARRLSPATYRETGIHLPDTGYVAVESQARKIAGHMRDVLARVAF